MKQLKISVSLELAAGFKAACAASNVSMAGKLSAFMAEYTKAAIPDKPLPDYTTRRRRRYSIKAILKQLEQIKAHEERYRDNIPENLQGSIVFDNAEQSVSFLDEAMELLGSVYEVP
jgi:hypothetical protein